MDNKQLLEKVRRLGFPLVESEERLDVNQTLAEVVKSNDARLAEGFAVLLANAAQDKNFSYEKVESYLTEDKDKSLLRELFFLSLGLYKAVGFYFHLAKLSNEDAKQVEQYRDYLAHDSNFNLKEYVFSPERLKGVFTTYLTKEVEEVKKQTEKQEDFSLEYALSQVFSPKQKELFMKKVKGLELSKTEREYFSRTVKKKLFALTNPELSRVAKLLL